MTRRQERIDALARIGLEAEKKTGFNHLPREGLQRSSDSDLDMLYETYVAKTAGERLADVLDRHGITQITTRAVGGFSRVAMLDEADAAPTASFTREDALAALAEMTVALDTINAKIASVRAASAPSRPSLRDSMIDDLVRVKGSDRDTLARLTFDELFTLYRHVANDLAQRKRNPN